MSAQQDEEKDMSLEKSWGKFQNSKNKRKNKNKNKTIYKETRIHNSSPVVSSGF